MTLNFNNVSNSEANNRTISNIETKENALDTTVEFKELEQESTLSDTTDRPSQLKLRRQKRQYGSDSTRLFEFISQHGKGNPPTDKTAEISNLLPNVSINYQDGDGDTFLHAAVQEGHKDIFDLLLGVQGIDVNIRNNQGKTPFDLANELDSNNPNKQYIITQLGPVQPAQPGPSSVHTNLPRVHETHPASGLKNSLHGNIYQLKLLMLFLKRGLKKGYDFRFVN